MGRGEFVADRLRMIIQFFAKEFRSGTDISRKENKLWVMQYKMIRKDFRYLTE